MSANANNNLAGLSIRLGINLGKPVRPERNQFDASRFGFSSLGYKLYGWC
jgi:hypothetical protein